MHARVTQFKKDWLSQVLFDNIYKTHQAMLAYGRSSLEYQDIQISVKQENAEAENTENAA